MMRIKRPESFSRWFSWTLPVVALLIALTCITGAAWSQSNRKVTVDLLVDLSTLDGTDLADGIGPFFVKGKIYPSGTLNGSTPNPTATPLGSFLIWGWFVRDSSGNPNLNGLVHCESQEFIFSDGSKIEAQGISSTLAALEPSASRVSVLGITGGTGRFANVRGSETSTFLGAGTDANGNPVSVQFHVSYELIGT